MTFGSILQLVIVLEEIHLILIILHTFPITLTLDGALCFTSLYLIFLYMTWTTRPRGVCDRFKRETVDEPVKIIQRHLAWSIVKICWYNCTQIL